MPQRFADRLVWIIGASSGIGAALAQAFACEGAKLVLSARREERLREVAEACEASGSRPAVLPLDVRQVERAGEHAAAVEAAHGVPDLLVLNAGLGQRGDALESDLAVDRTLLETNLLGPIACAKAVLPGMLARGSGQLAVVSSILGQCEAPHRSAYVASKHGLMGFFETLRLELEMDGETGLAITLLCPGWVRTEIGLHALEADGSAHGRTDPGQEKGIAPEVCAARMLEAISRRRELAYIGGMECAGPRLKRLSPRLYRWALKRFFPGDA